MTVSYNPALQFKVNKFSRSTELLEDGLFYSRPTEFSKTPMFVGIGTRIAYYTIKDFYTSIPSVKSTVSSGFSRRSQWI